MKNIVIDNYIEIDGKDIHKDSLPKEREEQINLKLQDVFFYALGYRRDGNSNK